MSVSIAAGTPFVVQMSDYRTTGFLWFLDSVAPADIATYHSNISAGGVTGPPYKNVSFTAGPGTGEGLIVMEHVRGWQRADPAADRGFARLHLSVHGAGPSPAPPSPAANKTHYGDPSTGCMSDEQVVQITGVKGAFCAPDCAAAACPADVPAGSTAQPQCALAGSTGSDKKCALICAASADEASLRAGDAQCGAGASCKAIQSTGICTYDDGPAPGPSPGPSPGNNTFAGAIFKTSDGGKTFTTLFHNEGEYYFNGIHCASETHCLAVAEGDTGTHIFVTHDGMNFTESKMIAGKVRKEGGRENLSHSVACSV